MIGKVDGTSLNLANDVMVEENIQKKDVSSIQRPEISEDKAKFIRDEYISGKDKEHTGLYKVVNDENGNKKIVYDKIEKETSKVEESKVQKENAVQRKDERKEAKKVKEKKEMGYVNTDAVDREIEALKKKRDNLLREIAALSNRNTETRDKLENLKRELEQAEKELMQKDNDGYRKQKALKWNKTEK